MTKVPDIYTSRVWLNPYKSSFTGSIVTHHDHRETYLELADCSNKARIHRGEGNSIVDFVKKLRKIKSEIEKLISYLEKKYPGIISSEK